MNKPASFDAYGEAIAKGYLPIREVAALTGVNPVTLRAWERRYGLIVPHRTAKGHRLYSGEQVQTIRDVLGWLNRGVSVGQVKGLLHADQPLPEDQASRWQEKRQRLSEALRRLDERQLDEAFNAELSLYPPLVLCQHLLLPLLSALEPSWQETERLFFCSWLRSKLGARVYHDNRQHQGHSLLLVNLDRGPISPQLWLCAWLIGTAGCRVDTFDGAIPADEVGQAIARLQPRAALLFCGADSAESLDPWLDRQGPTRLLVGLPASLAEGVPASPDIISVADTLAALHALADRRLLE